MSEAVANAYGQPARKLGPLSWLVRAMGQSPVLAVSLALLTFFAILALLAPWITEDPARLNPIQRLKPPSAEHWFGTDNLGRPVFARVIWGTRVSLTIGLAVTVTTVLFGVAIGVLAGYFRALDSLLMRMMDAVMAVPSILLAIALVALVGASPLVLVIAISVPEIPRMARVVRANVLMLRDRPYVEAAVTCGGRLPRILSRHILPGTLGPILVQATYVFASAMILEAILSFLGAGTPPDVPSWGNMMSEGRQFLQLAPWILGFPAVSLSAAVLAVNLVGDVLRDHLDPSLAAATKNSGGSL